MFVNLLPISGALFAVPFLDEVIRASHLIGLVRVLSATWVAVKRNLPASRASAAS